MTHPEAAHTPIGDEIKPTTCYMCACRCGIRVHLKDGTVRYIDGNRDHPVNRGVICAKGSAGVQQHRSPARLSKPLKRVGERGAGEFVEIEWDEALAIATQWLGDIRARNPDELAFFTGRDQSQALTGWWAQQFGTVNYAAHGGFCSVNMAAAGMYTLGSAFWEFGEPDFHHTRYLMMWGVAEDHDSNPLKLGLGELKGRGAKLVAINPVRTGYAALADEWIAIRPGTDGLLALALVHELLRLDRVDLEYLVRYTNAHWLVIDAPGSADDGLFARDAQGRALCASRASVAFHSPVGVTPAQAGAQRLPGDEGSLDPGLRRDDARVEVVAADSVSASPILVGEYTLADGRRAKPAFRHLAERYLEPSYAPEAVAERCGVDADTIRRIARELASVAFDQPVKLPIAWTDVHGRRHEEMIGRPVAMHAMRGISAHSNGFQTCRALHLLQMLLGAVETPGSFRFQPPFPRAIPPANKPGTSRRDNGALDAGPLGYPQSPADLLVDARGEPRRIDHAYSWKYPLAVHGMLHTVIRNAWARDPYPIDTLMLFMANMSWNSAMNTAETMKWLTDRDETTGEYRIPRVIYSDAYASEMVAYADLVFPDTTYLERHDAISLLDRPISDADGVADGMRHPVVEPDRDVRGFQSVLLQLGAKLGLPGMADANGAPVYRDYADYIVRHERAPGVGLLAGWRGDGTQHGVGAPNPDQLKRYVENGCFFRAEIPEAGRYFKMANHDYLEWAASFGFVGKAPALPVDPQTSAGGPTGSTYAPITLQIYSEHLQRFRLAARGHGAVLPPEAERTRIETHFDPLPIWYEPFEATQLANADDFPLHAITQRPMFMYHAWHSQNRWLRQIATRNYLYVHPATATKLGIADLDWAELASHHGRIRMQVKHHDGVEPNTVWTWNAIGKRRGAWKLGKDAPEGARGFLLNHLISDALPRGDHANADPITGQAAWYDLRVRLDRVGQSSDVAEPQFAPLAMTGVRSQPAKVPA